MTDSTPVPLSHGWQDWQFGVTGRYSGWSDRRGLYSVRHPWQESQSGDMASLSRQISVPEDWDGPVLLSFFVTSNHHGLGFDYRPSDWHVSIGADIFVGHRFGQVLLDEELVWERDVAYSDSPTWRSGRQPPGPAYCGFCHEVDISDKVRPGQTCKLVLRVLDKVGSGTPLPGDIHQEDYWLPADWDREQANRRFESVSWWGDVFLCKQCEAPGTRVTFDQLVEQRGYDFVERRKDSLSDGAPKTQLTIAHADSLPNLPYPLWGGIPFPEGLVKDRNEIRLLSQSGEEMPCHVQVCSRWRQDDSVQWAWLNTVVSADQHALVMECGKGVKGQGVQGRIAVSKEEGKTRIDTGLLEMMMAAPGDDVIIHSLRMPNGTVYGPVVGILNQQMLGWKRQHIARCEDVIVEEAGPVRASVCIKGHLSDEKHNRFGRFVARLWAWGGSPLLSLSYRVFQDTDQLVAMVDDLLLTVGTPFHDDVRGGFSPATFCRELPTGQVRELELRQTQPHRYAVVTKRQGEDDVGEHAPGWVDVRGRTEAGTRVGLACGVRWFWQQAPKSLTVTPNSVILGLFERRRRDDTSGDSPIYMMTRGEAKRHHIWLLPYDGSLSVETLEQVQRAWDVRPHLVNGDWFAQSRVLGNFAQHGSRQFPEFDHAARIWHQSELGDVRYGIREFRESRHIQNYRGMAANGLLEYLASGRPRWQAYFEQVLAHNLDVDTIHFEPDRPDWVGAIRRNMPNHTSGHAGYGINSNCQDQFLHYFFAGEPDSLEEATLAAEYIARLPADQGRSARQEGWPMAQLAAAYLWTGNEAYRQAIEGWLAFAHRYTHPRRGAFDEMHESISHRGIVPFETAYLGYGLIKYHQATGDVGAARLLVSLTEAVHSETGDGNGWFCPSPAPTHRTWGMRGGSSLVGGMLAYCYRITGDAWFAREAKVCYERIAADGDQGLDMAQLVGEMLSGIELAALDGVLG